MDKEALLARINRIVGQCKGLKNMVENKRECAELLQQIIAVRASLSGLGREVVKQTGATCVKKGDTEKLSELVELIVKL